ncbi:MAG: hypothetical protein Kow001_03400 [Acidobacteriota bacterium]
MNLGLERVGRAVIVAGAALVLGNEILSCFRALRLTPVLLLWLLVGIGVFAYLRPFSSRAFSSRGPAAEPETRFVGRTFIVSAIALGGYVLVASLWLPPNTWDSMVFHLPRQVRWIQQGSLEHFPTHTLLQLFRGPLAETWQANLQIIFGSDHVTKLISAASGGMVALFAALVARGWGASARGRWLAVWLSVTIPIGFLESLTTKNDLMVTAWILAAVWLAQRAYQGQFGYGETLLVGCAMGMAGLTKATGWFFLAGLAPWLVHALWRVPGRWRCGLLALLPLIAINFGHWSRNLKVFGQPIYLTRDFSVHPNQSMTPARVVSGLVKEASFHLATPWDAGNRLVESWIRRLHDALDVDVLDPATTYPERSFSVRFRPYSESEAGAPLHFLLLVSLPALAWRHRRRLARTYLIWSWAPLGLFIWTALATRWEPYLNPRLHLTPLALAAALLPAFWPAREEGEAARGREKSNHCSPIRELQWTWVLFMGCLLQLAPTLYWSPRALHHQMRTDPGRWQYQQAGVLAKPYEAAIALVASRAPAVVGLDSGGHPWGWEYPLMRGLRRTLFDPRFVAVNVRNVSAALAETDSPSPDVVVALRPVEEWVSEPHGVLFRRVAAFDFLTVLEPVAGQK